MSKYIADINVSFFVDLVKQKYKVHYKSTSKQAGHDSLLVLMTVQFLRIICYIMVAAKLLPHTFG